MTHPDHIEALDRAVEDLERAEHRAARFALHLLVLEHQQHRALILAPCPHDGHAHLALTAVEAKDGTFATFEGNEGFTSHLALDENGGWPTLMRYDTDGVYDLETGEFRVDVAIYLAGNHTATTASEMEAWV